MIRQSSPILLLAATLLWVGCDAEQPTQLPHPTLQPPDALNATVGEGAWAVAVPEGTGTTLMMSGDDATYLDGIDNVVVTVEKNKLAGSWGQDNDFVSHITFAVANPTARSVDFENVSLRYLDPAEYDFVDPDLGHPCCVFPVNSDCSDLVCNYCADCTCIADFLNGAAHPYNGYSYFRLEVGATDVDLLGMPVDETYQLGQEGHENDYARMTFRADSDPGYHDLKLSKSAHLGAESLHPFNIWITRTGPGAWSIEIGRADKALFMFAEESYSEPINPAKTETYSTLFRGGDFTFVFDLINESSTTPTDDPPAAPTALDATAFSCTQVDLSWTDNSDNESGFEIQRDETEIVSVGSDVTAYQDGSLSAETQYAYRVRAFNAEGASDWSNEASARTLECPSGSLAAPTGLKAKQPGKAPKVVLEWTDNSEGEEGFIIHRTVDSSTSSWKVDPNTTSYTDETIASGATYDYQVCAFAGEEESCSAIVEITTK